METEIVPAVVEIFTSFVAIASLIFMVCAFSLLLAQYIGTLFEG